MKSTLITHEKRYIVHLIKKKLRDQARRHTLVTRAWALTRWSGCIGLACQAQQRLTFYFLKNIF